VQGKPLFLFLAMLCVRLRRLLAAAYGVGRGSELLGNDELRGRPPRRVSPCVLCEKLSALSIFV
jgi:hypothetical protein